MELQGRSRTEAQTGHFFHPWGVRGGGGGVAAAAAAYTQSSVTSYINETPPNSNCTVVVTNLKALLLWPLRTFPM